MIARHSAVLSAVVFALDAATAILCFFASFYAKMYLVMPDPELKTGLYYQLLAIEVPFVMAALALNGLYSQRSLFAKLADQAQLIAKASIQVLAIFIVVSFYAKLFPYSRAVFTLYFVMLPIGL